MTDKNGKLIIKQRSKKLVLLSKMCTFIKQNLLILDKNKACADK